MGEAYPLPNRPRHPVVVDGTATDPAPLFPHSSPTFLFFNHLLVYFPWLQPCHRRAHISLSPPCLSGMPHQETRTPWEWRRPSEPRMLPTASSRPGTPPRASGTTPKNKRPKYVATVVTSVFRGLLSAWGVACRPSSLRLPLVGSDGWLRPPRPPPPRSSTARRSCPQSAQCASHPAHSSR